MRKMILIPAIVLTFSGTLSAQQDSIWTLDKCIEHAFERNIQVRKSEVANDRFGLYSEQARAQRYPSLNGSINQSFTWSNNSATGDFALTGASGSNYSLNSGVTLYNASRISNQIRQADLELEGGKYSLETTKEAISLSILDAYLQVLYSGELVNNSKKQIESTSGQLALAKERLDRQVISISDYAQVKSQLASEELILANSESQLSISKINLMQLMELPVVDNFKVSHPDIAEKLNQQRIPDVKAVYATALEIKPQIKNSEINKQVASLDEKIARSSYFPILSASAGLSSGYSTSATDPYFSQLNKGIRPSVGLTLSIPVYQKKQVKTSVAVAKLGYEDAVLSDTDTKNQLRKNIEQACLDVTSAQVEYEASQQKYNATLESSNLSDEKFRQGIINSVDYLVQKTNLIVAESQLLQSKYKLIFAYKVLDFYMGIPLSL